MKGERSDREDTWKTQHKDGLYIHGAKVKLLMQSTWKQATLLFLTHIQIHYFISPQAGIHSFIQQKFIGCFLRIRHCFGQWGYCSGTFWWWEERQINTLYYVIHATQKNKSVNNDTERHRGVGGYNFKYSHQRRSPWIGDFRIKKPDWRVGGSHVELYGRRAS